MITKNLTAFESSFWAYEWNRTPLGRTEDWPELLRSFVGFILSARQPMMLTWGRQDSLLFNEGFAEFLGPAYEDSLGKSIRQIWAPEWDAIAPYFEPAKTGISTVAEEVSYRTSASQFKEARSYSCAYTPIRDAAGAVAGVHCAATDITHKLEAAAQLRDERDALSECFEVAPGFVALMEGPLHCIVLANAACRSILGNRDVIGLPVAKAIPEVVPQGFVEILDKVYNSGEAFVANALPVKLPDHTGILTRKYIDVVYAPWRNRHGEIVGVLNEGHDVTAHVATSERAHSLQTDLIHLSRVSAMGTMASAIAHEINQPLGAIVNLASMARRLLERGDEQNLSAALANIIESSLKAARIIKNVREMSLKREPKTTPINIGRTVANTIKLFGPSDENRIVCEIDRTHTALGDEIQIQQVLLNLIKNGLEAVEAKSDGLVRIASVCRENDILVTVEDNGVGIGEPLKSIFEPFLSAKPEGVGIGLAISNTIIEAHGGRLWAKNLPAGGALLSFTLPKSEI